MGNCSGVFFSDNYFYLKLLENAERTEIYFKLLWYNVSAIKI